MFNRNRSFVVSILLVAGSLVMAGPAQAVSCLIFPLSCLKKKVKFGDDFEATIMDIRTVRTEHYELRADGTTGSGWSALQNNRHWYVWYRYGHTLYQAERVDTIAQMAFGYKPNRAEWIGKTIKMRLADEKWMGIKGTSVRMTRPDGKEWTLALVSIVGPDGKDECARSLGIQYCPPQTKIDRDAVEEAQLAALAKSGGKDASEVAPMPVEVPDDPNAVQPASEATTAPQPTATPEQPTAPQQSPAPEQSATLEQTAAPEQTATPPPPQ